MLSYLNLSSKVPEAFRYLRYRLSHLIGSIPRLFTVFLLALLLLSGTHRWGGDKRVCSAVDKISGDKGCLIGGDTEN